MDFSSSAPQAAQSLIGYTMLMNEHEEQVGGVIIETEAYTKDDPASHSYIGQTARNAAMFMAPGTLYLYRSYGIHTCLNIVVGNRDGQAVLIRALKPTIGIRLMELRRGGVTMAQLTNGPGKVTQAMGLTMESNAIHITRAKLQLIPPTQMLQTEALPRVGISKAVDTLWRFRALDA